MEIKTKPVVQSTFHTIYTGDLFRINGKLSVFMKLTSNGHFAKDPGGKHGFAEDCLRGGVHKVSYDEVVTQVHGEFVEK